MDNIHPIFDQILGRSEKEALLEQKGLVLWMVGLSGSGKSTLAKGLQVRLHQAGFLTQILDGDNLRSGLNKNLGFSTEDRKENIRRVAEVAKLFGECGIVTICSFISPTAEIRSQAKSIIGESLWKEVYVNASLEACEKRDVKGLYAKARVGEIKHFTGIDSPFDPPAHPAIEIKTDALDLEEALSLLYKKVEQHIKW